LSKDNKTAGLLPPVYDELEPFIDWALPTMKERLAKRLGSQYKDAEAFYKAIFPRVQEIISFLDEKGADKLSEAEQRLFYMLLSVVEISTSIEIYKDLRVPQGVPHERFPMWEAVSSEW
jgi:hypothetical protein